MKAKTNPSFENEKQRNKTEEEKAKGVTGGKKKETNYQCMKNKQDQMALNWKTDGRNDTWLEAR